MKSITVVGGGTAGWLTALYSLQLFPNSKVTVIASSEIGVLGAGEGTTPAFNEFVENLGIDVNDIIKKAAGTVKSGIRFTNWNGPDTGYYHPFWEGRTALHFDANLLAKFLQDIAIGRGIQLIDDVIVGVDTRSLTLQSGQIHSYDFIFDCSGFRRLIIGQHYNSTWNSYSRSLPAKRAMPFFIPHNGNIPEYTESIAMKYGWVWRIPVQGRYGCGYVFDSDYITDAQALAEIQESFGPVTSPRTFNFAAGSYSQTWINNAVAIGLSAGFTEPLEATSIWTAITSLQHFKDKIDGIDRPEIKELYNRDIEKLNQDFMTFIHFHYLSQRNDSEFWQEFATKNTTPDFIQRMGRRAPTQQELDYLYQVENPGELYKIKTYPVNSWLAVGNGIGYFNG